MVLKNPPTIMTPDVALELVKMAHRGQTDLAGKPYIHHPIRVANMMVHPRHKMLALLHDVMEDGGFTEDRLVAAGLPLDALSTMRLLTRKKGTPYMEYIEALADDFDALVVKMGDLRDNMDLTRLPELKDKDIERVKKYHKAYLYLQSRFAGHIEDANAKMENSNAGNTAEQ